MIEKALYFIGGMALGAVAAAIPIKMFYEKRCAEDVAEIKEHYRKSENKLVETRARLIKEVENVNEIGKKIAEENIGIGKKKKINTEKSDYQKHYKAPEIDPAETVSPVENDEVDEEYLANKRMNDARGDSSQEPAIIDQEDFGSNPVYETMELYLYQDGVIADDNDQMVEDPRRLLGDIAEWLEDENQESVCVRNYELGVDIELTKAWSNYSDIVR